MNRPDFSGDYPTRGNSRNSRGRSNLLVRLLADASAQLLMARDGDALVRTVYETIAPALDLHAYFNFMVNEAGDALYLASCAGIPEAESRAISRLEFGQAVCGTVALLRRPMVATCIQESEDPKVQLVRGYGIRAYACNPLMAGERLMGTLSFATRSRDRFAEDEVEFFRTLTHYVAVTEDRLRMTRALQQQAELLDLAQDAIIAIGFDGAVQFWNRGAETLYGWSAAQSLGCNYVELLGAKLPRSLGQIRDALIHQPVWEIELAHQHRTGRPVQVWSRWAARHDSENRQTGFLILEHDVSERNRIEDHLRHTQKLESLGVLAGGIAHDFNNLLTGILGGASLLEDEVLPHAKPLVNQVMQGAEQAAHLTRQLLAYAGKGSTLISDIDISAFIRQTAAFLRVSVSKNIEIQLDLAPDLPPIRADRGQLQQVLMNLLINAGEAIGTSANGIIRIRTAVESVGLRDGTLPPGEYVMATVTDNGCGMDGETAERIFDPFFSTKFVGRGLGLSAVHGIMRSCGGRITVESRHGLGSTFRLLFPAAQVSQADARPADSSGLPASCGTILVVDDEPAIRQFVKATLERAGFTVLTAGDGEPARLLIERETGIDLLLLDMMMPRMAGPETLSKIVQHRPSIKVLLTSGYPVEEVERQYAGAANYPFIQKPYRASELVAKVSTTLQNHIARRTNDGHPLESSSARAG